MLQRVIALTASVLALGLLAAGCGGGDDNDTAASAGGATTNNADAGSNGGESNSGDSASDNGSEVTDSGEELSSGQAAFIEEANAICDQTSKKVASEFGALFDEASSKQDFTKTYTFEIVIPNLEAQAQELRTLDVPSGDESQVEEIIDGLEQSIEDIEAKPNLFPEASDPYIKMEKPAERYGLESCPVDLSGKQ